MSEIFAPGSIAGPPATFMGPHNSGTSYAIGSAVSSDGSSYVSLIAGNVGNDPATSPTQWALLAAGGAKGTAGTVGANGAPGAAGSAAAISALAGAIMPGFAGRNLFDLTQVVPGTLQSDGTLFAYSNWVTSGLIFCPGAASMSSNLPIQVGDDFNASFALYDANGSFLSTLPASNFSFATGQRVISGVAFPLPGTQTYIRCTWSPSTLGSYGATASIASAMIYALVGGTASLPGAFQPFGFDTPGNVDAKDAIIVANAAASKLTALNIGIGLVVNSLLPSPVGGNRNVFDATKAILNTVQNPDGTLGIHANGYSIMVYAPDATQFITNLRIRGIPNGWGVGLYDALGNFLEDISTTTLAASFTNGNTLAPNVVYSLPGTQTYIRFSYDYTTHGMFFAGTVAAPCPTSLPQGAAFAGSQPVSIKTASQLGCVLDSDLNAGGGTDNTYLLNSFLATASEANPVKLILDGPILVSGLVIAAAGYTTIEGIGRGSGIYMINNANQDGVRIGVYTAATGCSEGAYNIVPPTRTATKIALRNFTINNNNSGNSSVGGTYAPDNTPVAGAVAHTLFGTVLANCTDVVLEGMNYINAPWFNVMISNASNIMVRGCEFTSIGYGRDGVHIDGKCEDITISDCAFATGDDAIALNSPEGYGGDISRVSITNCRFLNALTALRIYTSLDAAAMPSNNVHKVRNVVMSNCTGSVTTVVFNFGITNGGLSATYDVDQIQDFTVSNCSFVAPQGLALLLTPVGSISFRDVTFIPTGTSPVVNILFRSVGELDLRGLRVVRNGDGNAAPASVVFVYSGVTVNRLSILDFAVIDEEGSIYAAIPCILDNSGVVAALRLEGVDTTHVAALVSSAGWGNVTALRGGGVAGTGIAVPDSVMENNALYLSSTAGGVPSIKVGGVAQRLTQF